MSDESTIEPEQKKVQPSNKTRKPRAVKAAEAETEGRAKKSTRARKVTKPNAEESEVKVEAVKETKPSPAVKTKPAAEAKPEVKESHPSVTDQKTQAQKKPAHRQHQHANPKHATTTTQHTKAEAEAEPESRSAENTNPEPKKEVAKAEVKQAPKVEAKPEAKPDASESHKEQTEKIPAIQPIPEGALKTNQPEATKHQPTAPKPEIHQQSAPAQTLAQPHNQVQTQPQNQPQTQSQNQSQNQIHNQHQHQNHQNQNRSRDHRVWDKRRVQLDLNNPRTPAGTDHNNDAKTTNSRPAPTADYETLKSLASFISATVEIDDFKNNRVNAPGYALVKKILSEASEQLYAALNPNKPKPDASSDHKSDDSSETSESAMAKVRTKLGEAIEAVQYVEFNLGLLLMYNRVEKDLENLKKSNTPVTNELMDRINRNAKAVQESVSTLTFGSLISTVSEANIMSSQNLDELKDILTTRNYLVHQFFKKETFEEQQNNIVFLNQKANYLTKYHNRVTNFNDMLTKRMGDMYARIKGSI